MNILIISPSNAIGGAELSLLENVKYLNRHNIKPVLVLPPTEKDKLGQLLEPYCKKVYRQHLMRWIWKFSTAESIKDKVISFAYSYRLSGGYFRSAARIADIARKHDIQLIHTNASAVIDGAIAARKLKIPHLYHIREITGKGPSAIVSYPLQAFPSLFKKLSKRWHTHVVFNSQFCLEEGIPYFGTEHISVIHNGFSESWFGGIQFKNRTKNVGVVANITSSAKNHIFALQTANVLQNQYINHDIQFNFFGGLPLHKDVYFQRLETYINKNQLQSIVSFKGIEEPENIYLECDVLLHPTLNESFGRIFIEAMGKGVPVVAVSSGGARELIQHGETGFLVSPDAPEKAAEYILDLLNNPDLYHRIQQAAYSFAVNFSIEKTGQHLLRLYEQMIYADHT
jgi:glycosyltransferase involved in cell wall biosynthesis